MRGNKILPVGRVGRSRYSQAVVHHSFGRYVGIPKWLNRPKTLHIASCEKLTACVAASLTVFPQLYHP